MCRIVKFNSPLGLLAALVLPFLSVRAASPVLVWSDEFNQPVDSAPDAAKWTYDLGNWGWGNNELENYTNERVNSRIVDDPDAEDGRALGIFALKETAGGYTSARLKTEGRYAKSYGRIEARIKTTNGKGIWPAFWMLGENISTVNWPECGEIDVMEVINADPNVAYGTLHGPGAGGAFHNGNSLTLTGGDRYDLKYHVFAIDWSPGEIVWSIDNVVYHRLTPALLPTGARWVFDNSPFFLLLNVAVGGNWPGSPDATTTFPQRMLVDYVRVYGEAPLPPTSVSGFASDRTHVTLTWRRPPGLAANRAATYRVQRATNAAFSEGLAVFESDDATAYVDATALAGTQYHYRVFTRVGSGVSEPSASVTVTTPTAASGGTAQLINISSRALGGTGNDVTIGGFVITGTVEKPVLLRAVGPSLTAAGLTAAEVMADPTIELHRMAANGTSTVLRVNNDWTDNENASEITATAQRVGAMTFSDDDRRSAAILLNLPAGVYSFIVRGNHDGAGIVLAEIYDADPADQRARLVNIASRARRSGSNGVTIGGFVITGSGSKRVLIRAVGPTLASLGLESADVLANPWIELHDMGRKKGIIAVNDDWDGGAQATAISTAAAQIGATALDGLDNKSSALLVNLPAGVYSFVIQSANEGNGIVLAEIYDAGS